MNLDKRRALVETVGPSDGIKVGDRLPDVRLKDVDGGELTLAALTAAGPAVLVFVWLVRTEAEPVLEAARALTLAEAA